MSDPILRNASDAKDFASMPNVNGDPIVESGSNSDGEWTRWADGTQHCSRATAMYPGVSDVRFRPFPVPLVVALSGGFGGSGEGSLVPSSGTAWSNRAVTFTQSTVSVFNDGWETRAHNEFSEIGEAFSCLLFAIGRWK